MGLRAGGITATIGIVALSAAFIGTFLSRMSLLERLAGVAAGLMLISPEPITDYVGLLVAVGLFTAQFLRYRALRDRPALQPEIPVSETGR